VTGPGGDEALAFWLTGPGTCELRREKLAPGEVTVRTLYSGISRGTESLVAAGRVPQSEWQRMRCPMQGGDFPFPVKYGYAAVGEVEAGPPDLLGRLVFALHPHQDRFTAPASMVVPVPDGVPARRAVLAANMETALNAVWDSRAGPCDRIAVIGAGVIGLLIGWLAARIPGTEVTLVDINPARAPHAEALGCNFAAPASTPPNCDLTLHTTTTPEGLDAALKAAGQEARVVEVSWHGVNATPVHLGDVFHSRRLSLVSSQVGALPADRRARWSHRRRLGAALALLADPAIDVLVSDEGAFSSLPLTYHAVLSDRSTLCHAVSYHQEIACSA
jgi:NADPH:quinone reductase-like Zn-dependent oxidoreductase